MRELEDLHGFHVQTEHVLHAGMYARTVRLPAGVIIVGVLYKVPTMVIVHGACWVFAGEKWYRIEDYQVIPASAGRKQIFVTEQPTEITMVFRTKAKTVAEAEDAMTDEADKLINRRQDDGDIITITGVEACQE